MTDAKTLEQLIRDRKDLVEVHKRNNFTNGIHALLTDLYPDTAHFIFELLQNAEDMDATTARFILNYDGIDFEHNGTKRTFNVSDIDAITNIGHNRQKKDDKTSIGKFGVGFKAVFAYTTTPIIHSGDYHFRIQDYFVPDFYGVKKVQTVEKDGLSWTKFSFPFNNPKKQPNVAYQECLDGLRSLNATSILFLRNICKIECMLPNTDYFAVERKEDASHRVTVTQNKNGKTTGFSRWLRFLKLINIVNDQGDEKQLSIGVAFALKHDERTKKEVISIPKDGGKTFIYFPAEKEYSGLRFHINAPFASTVARDSVRDCQENRPLIRSVSQLLVESLPEIKKLGLMNHAFFETLPNSNDGLSPFYRCFFEDVYGAFLREAYLPTKDGGFVRSNYALMGKASISNLLRADILKSLSLTSKTWIANAPLRNSRADYFLRSLGVQVYTQEDFARIFSLPIRERTEKILGESEDVWLKSFYLLCDEMISDTPPQQRRVFIDSMKQTRMIRCTKGTMHKPKDIFFAPPEGGQLSEETPIVSEFFFPHPTKREPQLANIKAFMEQVLSIRTYDAKVVIERILSDWQTGIVIDNSYFSNLLKFATYAKRHDDIDFASRAIFLYQDYQSKSLRFSKASELYLGMAYGNSDGDLLSAILGRHCLWPDYKKHFNSKHRQIFVEFVRMCHIREGLTIEQQTARLNPLFNQELNSSGRQTGYGVDIDYSIQNLEELLKRQSIDISRLIWRCLQGSLPSFLQNYAIARYAPNNSAPERTCDSTLICLLKRYAWLPDKNGTLHRPGDVSISDLATGFTYDSRNGLLKALKIGINLDAKAKKDAEFEAEALRRGFVLVRPEEKLLVEDLLRSLRKEQKSTPEYTAQKLLAKQSRVQQNLGDNHCGTSDKSISLDGKRKIEEDIAATWVASSFIKFPIKKAFARTVESTDEERQRLLQWYGGRCQMCRTIIIKHNGHPHFMAINIINTQHLSNRVRQTTGTAWNSLCLCPNCAARFKYCSKNLESLLKQIVRQDNIQNNLASVRLTIELAGEIKPIFYDTAHFTALRETVKLIDSNA